MAERIARSQHAAAGLLGLLRQQSTSAVRPAASAPFASTSYHTASSSILPAPSYCHLSTQRSLHTTCNTAVSAHRKQAGREKARMRSMRQEERVIRRREKEYPSSSSHASSSRRPRNPIEEDVESNIRSYMARTGPKGERLTRSQQERLLKQELRTLSHQLETVDKKAKADEAAQDLPDLDDQVLDELYQALMLPPPPSAEESRLARLDGRRREQSLTGRGRMGLLPPTQADEASRGLKQRLIAAREKGKMLLPPSAPASRTAGGDLMGIGDEPTGLEDEINMAALPYAERQELRLQQLFARLALVHSGPEEVEAHSGSESLQEIKISLANRIAKILEEHKYELHPSAQPLEEQSKQATEQQGSTADVPAVQPLRIDSKASIQDVTTTPLPDTLTRAESMINDLSSAESRSFMLDTLERLIPASSSTPSASSIPLGVASIDEWTALAVSCARANDTDTLSRTLSLMQTSGQAPTITLYNSVLDAFASTGNVSACQSWLSEMSSAGLTPDNHTYHALTKAYITSSQFLPAIELLNSLEVSNTPASMATYTMVIDRLVNLQNKPELQSLAWNVFYHMRLHSHPVPDAPLYALMIRACAQGVPQPTSIDTLSSSSPVISDAERALDLFREMTTRYSVRPNAETYNALILACARRKDFYLEAFRLLREMVELETSRIGISGEETHMRFAPDRYTFNALLQGCARNRDLGRARWVLAEMIRCTAPLFEEGVREKMGRNEVLEVLGKRPNEETMCHVFHAYASYVPPVKRDALRTTSPSSSSTPTEEQLSTDAIAHKDSNKDSDLTNVETADEVPNTPEEAAQIFSALVPQTSTDLLSESRSLFARILADQPQPQSALEGPLGGVTPGTRLVNAYLTVLAAHLPPQQRMYVLHSTLSPSPPNPEEATLEEGLFTRLGLKPNEHSFRIILEALSEVGEEAKDIVSDVWKRFGSLVMLESGSGQELAELNGERGLDLEQVKKCWAAYIHFQAKIGSLDTAMELIRQFVDLYPPQVAPRRSRKAKKYEKIALTAELAKVGKRVDLTPLPVPLKSLQALQSGLDTERQSGEEQVERKEKIPKLSFLDVQLLHHRLVRYGRVKDLGYLSWILHRYQASSL